jgi:hypothetical protein
VKIHKKFGLTSGYLLKLKLVVQVKASRAPQPEHIGLVCYREASHFSSASLHILNDYDERNKAKHETYNADDRKVDYIDEDWYSGMRIRVHLLSQSHGIFE